MSIIDEPLSEAAEAALELAPDAELEIETEADRARSWLNMAFAVTLSAFIVGAIAGRWLMPNELCFRYLGCNAGFFGFDALLHFTAGVAESALIIWLALFPKTRMFELRSSLWKNALILIALVALLSIGWEILEYNHDHILRSYAWFRAMAFVHPMFQAQPSLSDTMGDLTVTLIGGLLTTPLLRLFRKSQEDQ